MEIARARERDGATEGERTRDEERTGKRENERAREAGTVHADTREITAFAYVWIHRSSERASASGRLGFIGLLQARRGMAARWREREERKRERKPERARERQQKRERQSDKDRENGE